MQFIDALSVLSKSSSYAVSTEHDLNQDLVDVKSDLYVTMPIEQDFLMKLCELSEHSKKVLFLCGSSGDGKSELLLRAKEGYVASHIKFHLDATHSFAPHDSAIDTLNKLFKEFAAGNHSLVIGINIGMLGNFAEEAECLELRTKLKKYLENKKISAGLDFLNFEDYPKFEITQDGYKADFITRLLKKITSPDSLLYKSFKADELIGLNGTNRLKFINYKLLCDHGVQRVIVELLFKLRLFRNQFITARNFLDLIFEIISGKGYLFDNLFECIDNEILEKLSEFDPAHLRTKTIDKFIISYGLNSYSEDFLNFRSDVFDAYLIENIDNANSYIRLFYIFKLCSIGNDYHKNFEKDFSEELLLNYIDIYRNHKFYDIKKSKLILRDFYNKELFSALRSYINKKAPYLEEDQYLIAEYDECQIVSILKLSPDFQAIESNLQARGNGFFDVYIKIRDFGGMCFSIDINLFELLNKLKSGYRPNKNDKSVVIILNEIVARLLKFANKSTQINLKNNCEDIRLIYEDDYIEVGGIK